VYLKSQGQAKPQQRVTISNLLIRGVPWLLFGSTRHAFARCSSLTSQQQYPAHHLMTRMHPQLGALENVYMVTAVYDASADDGLLTKQRPEQRVLLPHRIKSEVDSKSRSRTCDLYKDLLPHFFIGSSSLKPDRPREQLCDNFTTISLRAFSL
jgi:hypothetical protein